MRIIVFSIREIFLKVLTVLTTSDVNEYFINSRFLNPEPLLDEIKYTITDLSDLNLKALFLLKNLEIFSTFFIFLYNRPATMLMLFLNIKDFSPFGLLVDFNLITNGNGVFLNFKNIVSILVAEELFYLLRVYSIRRVGQLAYNKIE